MGFVVWPTSGDDPNFAASAEASFTALEGLCPVRPFKAQQQAALGGSVLFPVSDLCVLRGPQDQHHLEQLSLPTTSSVKCLPSSGSSLLLGWVMLWLPL